jgi:type IV pilus assembly protein PilV
VNRKYQTGAGLIEVLITVLILAIGLLGLAALQTRSLQYNHASALRSQANILASDIIDRMRLNRKAALDGGYNLAYDGTTPAGATLAQTDLREWRALLTQSLPSAGGAVNCIANGNCTISVRWGERVSSEDTSGDDENGDASEFSEFVYSTRI